ncbi:flagellar hook-length control protein FliK [Jeotgalibacillus sp. JSM ZJ347]|uniref:flagellar hook-length control protein FliK n=1 Tax=Jeotgalibacillus sp. JSM ZJ347 TaxID=3342117 RepID=UPI0035A8EF08
MIGPLTLQTANAPQQLGSVMDKVSASKDLFSKMLLKAGEESLNLNEVEISDIKSLFGDLMEVLETEDFSSFLKTAEKVDPSIKQMFLMFDNEEIMDLTLPELLLAAGVSEDLVDRAAVSTVSEIEQLLIDSSVTEGTDKQSVIKPLLNGILQLMSQAISQNNEPSKPDVQNGKLTFIHEDLAKLIILTKGLSLIDQKKSGADQSKLVQNLTHLMEEVEGIFKSAVKDLDAPIKQEHYNKSLAPEPLKTENGMLNLQTLQLQAGPVKWSLAQSTRQPDASQQLMEQFQQVMQKANFGKVNGTEKLMIRLQPEHLGTLKIELLQKDGMMTARIIASTAVAKEMIDAQLNQLRQSFNAQNLQVEKIEIAQTETAEYRLNKDSEQKQQGEDQRDNQQHNNEQSDDEQMSFHDIFLNIEV